eukprot:5763407-Amphidinium_carterae.1
MGLPRTCAGWPTTRSGSLKILDASDCSWCPGQLSAHSALCCTNILLRNTRACAAASEAHSCG